MPVILHVKYGVHHAVDMHRKGIRDELGILLNLSNASCS